MAPSEATMWLKEPANRSDRMNDDEINAKYGKRELRIVTENNREQLPNFVEALKRPGWMELRPFYQRRPRWDPVRQSKLIESFIMNIPVPPLFVYESDLAKYEVMDGQQRITAIRDFYTNKLELQGLEQWPELNGRIYDKLPTEIRKGIDRRSISYIVLLKESAVTTEEEALLRQQVFERLFAYAHGPCGAGWSYKRQAFIRSNHGSRLFYSGCNQCQVAKRPRRARVQSSAAQG